MTEFSNTDTVTIDDNEIIVSVVEGYGHKMWSDPKGAKHRLYLHRFEGKHRYDCGFFDFTNNTYEAVKKSNRKGDKKPYVLDGSGEVVCRLAIGDEFFDLTIKEKEEVKQASNSQSATLESGEPEEILQHLASITKSDTKIIVSYGNTVEVKSKARYGNIQTQYPKLSMQVEMDGGNTLSVIETVADNVVALVEKKLTNIINELIE